MKGVWLEAAERDRLTILEHIAVDNSAAAERMDRLFSRAARRLSTFPMLGYRGHIPGTREIVPHPSYRLVYAVEDDTVWVLALVHTARRWPPL
jgi:addiction module RelE/StbE family toxin